MRAVQITEFGGPEVLELVELPTPDPGPGQVLIDVSSAGVNYADVHQVEDSYLSSQTLPLVPGSEVVGSTLTSSWVEDGPTVGMGAWKSLPPPAFVGVRRVALPDKLN